jgi:hypothetical protein
MWTNPEDLEIDGKIYKAWARTRFKSAKASEWRVVNLPFPVIKSMNIKWPGRLGWGTKYEPWMEYKPYVEGEDEPV